MILAWCYLALLAAVSAVWGWFNLVPIYRRNLQHLLEPWDAPGTLRDARQSPGGGAPGGSAYAPTKPAAWDQSAAILCPGRDEAEHLPDTLEELCRQDHPRLRVVFIDDQSSDATGKLADAVAHEHPRCAVMHNRQDPPAGWVGKTWAVHQGYQRLRALERGGDSDGPHLDTPGPGSENPQPETRSSKLSPTDWLCFTDADIHWDPRCLTSAIELAERTGSDVVTLMPRLVFGSPIEAIVQTQLGVALGLFLPFERAMDPDRPEALTAGGFILVRRSLYDRIGGHESVKSAVIEDLAIGRKLKAAGGRMRIAMAPELLWCRMYSGLADMWEGLTKNAYAGLNASPVQLLGLTLVVLFANILPPVYVAGSLVWLVMQPGAALAWAALGLSLLTLLLPARITNGARKVMGLSWWYAWTMPVGSAFYLAMVWASAWRYYRGGNVWKGRSYGREMGAQAGVKG